MNPTLSGLQHLIDKCMHYSMSQHRENRISCTPANTHIKIQFHHISPTDNLKHLGFIWNRTRFYSTLCDKNIKEGISQFWAVIHGLIKGGIRFCHPDSIIELYKVLAIPTLTYGLEIPQLTQTQLDQLDVEGRKAIKSLFNLSHYSKNHLNHLYSIDNISSTITKNKLKLISRLMDNSTTKRIILSIMQSTSAHRSIVHDCVELAQKHDINFYKVLLGNNTKKVETIHDIVPEEVRTCIQFWNIGGQRKLFKDLMEDRVVRANAP